MANKEKTTKKGFFSKAGAKIKTWCQNNRRRIVQLYAALLTNANLRGFAVGKIYTGATKAMCVPGLNCYSCPGAIGACPLGSLQNALYSSTVRTPVFVIGILMIFGLMLGRTICGFLCPLGLGQELLHKIPSPKLKKNRVTKILSYFKYVLLVLTICIPIVYSVQATPFFCKYICPAGTLEGGIGLLSNPENADKFGMLNYLFTWKFILLVAFVVGSIFIYRFFCRFFCPLGAIYGFFNKFALIGVKLDKQRCIECGKCVTTCKMDISRVGDHECINCGECIPVCPTKAIAWKGSKFVLHPSEIYGQASIQKSPLEVTDGAINASKAVGSNNAHLLEAQAQTGGATVEKMQKRRKALKIIGYSLMAVTLIGALVYYNVIAPITSPDVNESGIITVGDQCPDFAFTRTYKSKQDVDHFTISENLGKVTVLNYWYTSCGPCVAELPHFEEVYDMYGGEINIVAVHSYDIIDMPIQKFIDNAGWNDYDILFVHDTEDQSYLKMGGDGAWPMTVVLDAEGKVVSVTHGKMSKEKLISEIEKAKN